MEFTIGQNSSLPLLKLQVVKDGIEDYNSMMEFIERSTIFFSMVDTANGIPKVYSKSAGFVEKLEMDPNASPEYYVYYRFTTQDTSRVGRYEGQFLFINDTGTLVLPIREPLFINIVESYIANDLPYDNCYTLNYVCCVTPFPTPEPTQSPFPVLSQTPTNTPTKTQTPTPTPTVTNTPTPTVTETPTPTVTNTPTNTKTPTHTPTNTHTPTSSITSTPTNTPTYTPTQTNTPSITPTLTTTPTFVSYMGSFVWGVNTLGIIYDSGTLTCQALACLPNFGCSVSNSTTVYFLNQNPQVGDAVYLNSQLTNQANSSTWWGGTFFVSYNFSNPSNSQAYQVINGIITQILNCPVTPTPTPTNTTTPTVTPSITTTNTNTPTLTETPTQTPTNTPTVTPTETPTQTPTPTITETPTPTVTETPTPTVTETPTPTPTPTPTVTETPTNTPTPTITETPTNTPTPTVTETPTNTPTYTTTPTNTNTPSPTPMPVTSNLRLYYDPSNPSSYSGSGTIINDLSGLGLNGTMSNITFTSPYFSYNGSSSQVSVADNPLLEPGSGDWSIECWVNYSVIAGSSRILIAKTDGGLSADWGYGLRTNSAGSTYMEIGNGTTSTASPSSTLSINTWYQVIGVWTNVASNSLSLYINGNLIGSVAHVFTSVKNTTSPLYLGSFNGGQFSQWFNGNMGIVRIYNKALSASEVLQNFNADKSKYGL